MIRIIGLLCLVFFAWSAASAFNLRASCRAVPDREKEPRGAESHRASAMTGTDADKVKIVIDGKEVLVSLSNVLPISQWPKDDTIEGKKLKAEALKAFKKRFELKPEMGRYLQFKRAHIKGDTGDVFRGDIIWYAPDEMTFKAPADYGWGTIYLNAWIIQEGWSVYVNDRSVVLGFSQNTDSQEYRNEILEKATRYAEQNKKGIWRNREFAMRIKAVAEKLEKKK